MSIRSVIFDLDGVLADLVTSHYLALNQALKEICGYEINEQEQVKYYNGISTERKLQMLINRGIVHPSQYQTVWNRKQELTFEVIDQLQLDPEKIRMCELLKADGYMLACVSNSIIKTTYKVLKQLDLLPFLEFYLGNEDFGQRIKPDPYPYELAFQKLGLKPSECVIIEDSPKGIMAAERSKAFVFEVSGPKQVNYKNVNNFLEKIRLVQS